MTRTAALHKVQAVNCSQSMLILPPFSYSLSANLVIFCSTILRDHLKEGFSTARTSLFTTFSEYSQTGPVM